MQDPDRPGAQAPNDLSEDERRSADLVHAVCDPQGFAAELEARGEELDAFLDAPEAQRELASIQALVGVARASAAAATNEAAGTASERLRSRRIANRVLSRTTREDRGWRGDVRLWADFVSDRLRDSALLRFAAALLLVQVTVVPMLAYHMLRERSEAQMNWTLDRSRADAPPVWNEDEEPLIEADPLLDESALDELAAHGTALTEVAELDGLARAARQRLTALDAEPTTAGGLATRSRLLLLEALLAGEDTDRSGSFVSTDLGAMTRSDQVLGERIEFESHLDLVAITGASPMLPSPALASRLAAAPVGSYGAWIRERAQELGCWPSDEPEAAPSLGLDPVLAWNGKGATPVADSVHAAWLEAWASR